VWAEKIMDLLGCKYDKNQVGLFVWGKLPESVTSSKDFIDNILYKARVFITPGVIFGSNGEGYIRISLGSAIEKMQEAYERVKLLISNY
jgi:aspartate/methionine/tyrosine aminotransferase